MASTNQQIMRTIEKPAALLALLILLISFSSSAFSAPAVPPLSTHSRGIRGRLGTSPNWAGYVVHTVVPVAGGRVPPQPLSVFDVKGSWVVPRVNCEVTMDGWASFWVGIDGWFSGTVEQTGTESDCSSGVPTYYAWYEMYPGPTVVIDMKISPGHTVSAEATSLAVLGGAEFLLTITDVTTGATFTTTRTFLSNVAVALAMSGEWIAEAPSLGGVLPLADFVSVTFHNTRATLRTGTGPINDPAFGFDRLDMVSESGVIKAVTSSLSPDGTSFSVQWYHS
jgi:hypothetical protein